MTQLIQVMRLTYLITESPKVTCSTGQTIEKTVAGENSAKDNNIAVQLPRRCRNAWKKLIFKQQKIRSSSSSNNCKEFKGICDGLAAIHKPVDEDSKLINFARGLGPKYKTFRTVMLGKGRVNYSQRRGNNNFNSRGRGFKPAGQGIGSYNNRNGPGLQNNPSSGSHEGNNSDAYQICGASSHMTHNLGILTDLKHYNGSDQIIVGNGSKLDITHVGNKSEIGLKLKEDKRRRTLLAKGSKRNGLYALEDNNLYVLTAAHDWNTSNNMWHTRLGHPREVQAASPHINSDNAATTYILLNDESTIDLSGAGSNAEEQVEGDDPYSSIETPVADFESVSSSEEQVALIGPANDHHPTTTLVDVPVDHQPDNATLQSTT
ncbi:hypothetical protein KY290_034147 [Solanum tuberosum]|uniref:GAG-pre-integrase domain-containing protein n=1 Tax=Solanum tuberosum TaxID=4113 RepID=A0ABQ7U3H1_SOLTU|nr:hypothetical protein KY290_034147 [Solanum tuberosum]